MKKSWWEVAETIFFGILAPLVLLSIICGLALATLWIGVELLEILVN